MHTDTTSLVLSCSRARVARWLFGSVAVVLAMNVPALVFQYLWDMPGATGYISFFGVSDEGKAPTFYSGVVILVAAALLAVIAGYERRIKGDFARHWLGLSLIFVFMAFDELLVVHELTMPALRRMFGITSGPFYFAWVIPAMAFLALFGLVYVQFLRALPSRTARAFIMAGAVYVAGALGMELVSAAYLTARGNDLIYGLMTATEEADEMIGIVLFVNALLDHLAQTAAAWRVALTP